MKNKKIIFNILVRIILIITNAVFIAFAYQIVQDEYIFVIVNLSILIIIQVIFFLVYFIRLNSDIQLFFEAISNNDSSLLFDSSNKSMLISNYNDFLKKINDVISEKNLEISKQKSFSMKRVK
jgi:hypothetical protein